MKISSLVSILAFILIFFGCLSSEEAKKQEVKNVILLIGNDSDVHAIRSRSLTNPPKGNLARASVYGIPKAKEINNFRSSTASVPAILAIGKEGHSGYLGLDSNGIAHPNLIELASVKGLLTGLITANSATDVLPASFIVHTIDGTLPESICSEYLNSPFDLFIGGGLQYFSNRPDGTDLVQRFKNKGYSVYSELDKAIQSEKLIVITDNKLVKSAQVNENQKLIKFTELALKSLCSAKNGFFLIIDGCLPGSNVGELKVSGQNNSALSLDQTIGAAFDFADHNRGTLVVVTTDLLSSVYTYGTMANSFEGNYENTEVFNKIITLLDLPVK